MIEAIMVARYKDLMNNVGRDCLGLRATRIVSILVLLITEVHLENQGTPRSKRSWWHENSVHTKIKEAERKLDPFIHTSRCSTDEQPSLA